MADNNANQDQSSNDLALTEEEHQEAIYNGLMAAINEHNAAVLDHSMGRLIETDIETQNTVDSSEEEQQLVQSEHDDNIPSTSTAEALTESGPREVSLEDELLASYFPVEVPKRSSPSTSTAEGLSESGPIEVPVEDEPVASCSTSRPVEEPKLCFPSADPTRQHAFSGRFVSKVENVYPLTVSKRFVKPLMVGDNNTPDLDGMLRKIFGVPDLKRVVLMITPTNTMNGRFNMHAYAMKDRRHLGLTTVTKKERNLIERKQTSLKYSIIFCSGFVELKDAFMNVQIKNMVFKVQRNKSSTHTSIKYKGSRRSFSNLNGNIEQVTGDVSKSAIDNQPRIRCHLNGKQQQKPRSAARLNIKQVLSNTVYHSTSSFSEVFQRKAKQNKRKQQQTVPKTPPSRTASPVLPPATRHNPPINRKQQQTVPKTPASRTASPVWQPATRHNPPIKCKQQQTVPKTPASRTASPVLQPATRHNPPIKSKQQQTVPKTPASRTASPVWQPATRYNPPTNRNTVSPPVTRNSSPVCRNILRQPVTQRNSPNNRNILRQPVTPGKAQSPTNPAGLGPATRPPIDRRAPKNRSVSQPPSQNGSATQGNQEIEATRTSQENSETRRSPNMNATLMSLIEEIRRHEENEATQGNAETRRNPDIEAIEEILRNRENDQTPMNQEDDETRQNRIEANRRNRLEINRNQVGTLGNRNNQTQRTRNQVGTSENRNNLEAQSNRGGRDVQQPRNRCNPRDRSMSQPPRFNNYANANATRVNRPMPSGCRAQGGTSPSPPGSRPQRALSPMPTRGRAQGGTSPMAPGSRPQRALSPTPPGSRPQRALSPTPPGGRPQRPLSPTPPRGQAQRGTRPMPSGSRAQGVNSRMPISRRGTSTVPERGSSPVPERGTSPTPEETSLNDEDFGEQNDVSDAARIDRNLVNPETNIEPPIFFDDSHNIMTRNSAQFDELMKNLVACLELTAEELSQYEIGKPTENQTFLNITNLINRINSNLTPNSQHLTYLFQIFKLLNCKLVARDECYLPGAIPSDTPRCRIESFLSDKPEDYFVSLSLPHGELDNYLNLVPYLRPNVHHIDDAFDLTRISTVAVQFLRTHFRPSFTKAVAELFYDVVKPISPLLALTTRTNNNTDVPRIPTRPPHQ